MWFRASEHVWQVNGIDCDQVPPSTFRRRHRPQGARGARWPSGWVPAKVPEGRGPAPGVLHAPDCEEAPEDTPLLDVQRALDVAENPGTQLYTLCGCAQELTSMLRGFDHIGNS